MELSMSDQLKMSYQPSLLNLTDVTFLQGSGSGTTHSREQDGPTIDECGPDRALASLSPRQAKEMGLLTSGTYGLRGSTLSSSADLASSLVSRYRAKTRCLGSTLFTLTWKVRYTPSRRPIFAVRASGLRISDRDCISWPTPTAVNREDDIEKRAERGKKYGFGVALTLNMAADVTNWRNPSASDGEGGVMEIRPETAGKYKLRDEAELVSWPTPCQQDGPKGGPNQGTDRLPGAADLSNWATPAARDSKGANSELHVTETGTGRMHMDQLANQAVHLTVSAWPTPKEQNSRGTSPKKDGLWDVAQLTDSGEMSSGSIAATGNGVLSGQLNPGHSRWLMSLPPIWDVCGIRAAENIRSRRSSKKAKAASLVSEATATP